MRMWIFILMSLGLCGCQSAVQTQFMEFSRDARRGFYLTKYEIMTRGDVDLDLHQFASENDGAVSRMSVGQSSQGVESPVALESLEILRELLQQFPLLFPGYSPLIFGAKASGTPSPLEQPDIPSLRRRFVRSVEDGLPPVHHPASGFGASPYVLLGTSGSAFGQGGAP